MWQALTEFHLLHPARALKCYRGPNPDAAAAVHQQYASALRSHGPRWPAPGFASRPGPTVNFAGLGLTPPCTDARLAFAWLNDNAVRTALHARPYDTSDSVWQLCSNKILYTREIRSMIPIHRNLTGAGLLALIYSGDHDLAVPHTGSERWTRELDLPVRHEWAPWYDSANQVSGSLPNVLTCCSTTEAPDWVRPEALASGLLMPYRAPCFIIVDGTACLPALGLPCCARGVPPGACSLPCSITAMLSLFASIAGRWLPC